MKNRKIVVVAFLLIAVLLLGVGYAALTVELSLTGNANIDPGKSQTEYTEDIYLGDSATITKDGGNTNTNTYSRTNNHSADLAVTSLALTGDTVTYEITINNESLHEVNVTIKNLKIQAEEQTNNGLGLYSGDEWISTKVEFPNGSTLAAGTDNGDGTVTPSSITVKLTFTLLKNPTDVTVRSINIKFDATTTD